MNKRLVVTGLLLAAWGISAPAASARTTLKVGSMTANGVTVKNLRCTLDRSGFLVAMSVVGTLAKQKKAFDRCAKKGAALAVSFTWSGGRTRRVKITFASNKRARKCIGKALGRLRPVMNGTCSMVLLAGKRKAAERAATKLLAKMKKARKKARKK